MKGKYQSAVLLPVLVGTLSANFIFFREYSIKLWGIL